MGSVDVREGDVVVPNGTFAEDSYRRCGSHYEEETNNNNRTTPDCESETPDGSSGSWEHWSADKETTMTIPGTPSYIGKDANSLTFQWDAVTTTGSEVPSYDVEMQQLKTTSTKNTSLDKDIHPSQWDVVYSGKESWTQVKSLSPGRCYAVRIRCRLLEAISDYTDTVVFRTTQTVPSGPQPPELNCLEHDAMTLKWRPPWECGGSEITGYRLQLWPPPGNSELQAINEIGEGPWSLLSCFKTKPYFPGIPRNLSARTTSPGCVQLEWTPSTQNGRCRDQYKIEIEHVERRCCHYDQVGTLSRHDIVGLDCGCEYRFRICGENEVGTGDWSYPLTLYLPPCVPTAPSKPTMTSLEQTAVACTWSQPQITGGIQPIYYQLEIISMASNMLEGCMRTWQTVYAGLDRDCYIRNLVPGCEYSLRVKAKNEAGWGSASPCLQFRTAPSLPLKPLVPHAVERNDRSMRIYWIPPAHDGGQVIQKYRLQMCPTDRLNDLDDDNPFSDVYEGTRNSAMIEDLQPGRIYALRVHAVNEIGCGPWSDLGYESTPPEPPLPPRNLRADDRGATQLQLTWNIPESDGGSAVERYQVEISKAGRQATFTECSFVQIYDGTALECTSTGLDSSTSYWVRIRAINDRGCSDWSPVLETETISDLPPVPSGLEALSVSCTNVHLTWHPLPPHTQIVVEVAQCEATWVECYNGSANTCHVDGLDPGTTVSFRTRGMNAHGLGPHSEVLTVDTNIDPPEIPEPPIVVQSMSSNVRLKWTMPSNNGRPVRYYRLEVKGMDGMLFETQVQGTVFRLGELTPKTIYEFRLSAVNELGSSPWSRSTTTTTKALPPLPPTDLKASSSGTSVEVTWLTESPESLQFEVEAYVSGSKKNKNLQPIVQETVTDCRCTLTGFDRNQKYEIRVRSISGENIGKWSNGVIVRIAEAPPMAKAAPSVVEEIEVSSPNRTKKGRAVVNHHRCKNPIRRRKSIRKLLKSHLPFIVIVVALSLFLTLILHK